MVAERKIYETFNNKDFLKIAQAIHMNYQDKSYSLWSQNGTDLAGKGSQTASSSGESDKWKEPLVQLKHTSGQSTMMKVSL